MPAFTYIEDLTKAVEIPSDGSSSQVLHSNDRLKVEAVAFSAGQQLQRHALDVPTILEVVKGQVRLDLDGEFKEAGPGAFVYMEANLPYAIYAKSDLLILQTQLTAATTK